LRRAGRHADDGASNRQAATRYLQQVTRLDGPSGAHRALAAVAVLATVVVVAGWGASISKADGDPASDVLLLQDVYFPYRQPSPAARAELQRAADAVYARGDRVRVALIFSADDLGSIPSMFGQPAEYAHFLGVELGLWYVGPLLVVMPAGFGIWNGGRSTAAEEAVLRPLLVDASSPDRLTQRATTPVQHLQAASAPGFTDIQAPFRTAPP